MLRANSIATKEMLDDFFQPLINKFQVVEEVKKQTDVYLASRFNFLDIIRPNENRISDLICLLCDPKGLHGQGEIFLSLFLNQLGVDEFNNSLNQVILVREEGTPEKRRVDIIIRHPEINYVVGIENKPWALEQTNQLSDYAEYLRNVSDNFKLIYIDGFKRKATSITEKEINELGNNFMELTYKSFLIPWLTACSNQCQADKVRWFLRDFAKWIDNNFFDLEN